MNSMGEPDAGNLHVRFDEGPGEVKASPGLLYREGISQSRITKLPTAPAPASSPAQSGVDAQNSVALCHREKNDNSIQSASSA